MALNFWYFYQKIDYQKPVYYGYSSLLRSPGMLMSYEYFFFTPNPDRSFITSTKRVRKNNLYNVIVFQFIITIKSRRAKNSTDLQ